MAMTTMLYNYTFEVFQCFNKEEGGTWVDDQFLCQECVDEHCTTCDHCGETIWANDTVQDDSITLCPTCYDDYYHRCECCGRIIHDNNTNWQGDMPYCDSCYDEFNDEIEEYSYKPDPVFYGDGNRYLGVELEVDCGGKDDDNASKLKEIANSIHEHIYIKSDGSIDDGFEIVSHPMTLDYHKISEYYNKQTSDLFSENYFKLLSYFNEFQEFNFYGKLFLKENSLLFLRHSIIEIMDLENIYVCVDIYINDLKLCAFVKDLIKNQTNVLELIKESSNEERKKFIEKHYPVYKVIYTPLEWNNKKIKCLRNLYSNLIFPIAPPIIK